jgi:uncharacterized protein involved in exopolysaccharide biosynthesis
MVLVQRIDEATLAVTDARYAQPTSPPSPVESRGAAAIGAALALSLFMVLLVLLLSPRRR